MRTTLDIDDDVLLAAKEIARRDRKSVGRVVSELARAAFMRPAAPPGLVVDTDPRASAATALTASERLAAYGIRPLAARGAVVSNDLIDRLRDAEGV
jgi:hypothetical protein